MSRKTKLRSIVFFLGLILLFFIVLESYFVVNNFAQEKKTFKKILDESFYKSIKAYKDYRKSSIEIKNDTTKRIKPNDTFSISPLSPNLVWNAEFDIDSLSGTEYAKLFLTPQSVRFSANDNGWYRQVKNPTDFHHSWKGKGLGRATNFMLIDGAISNARVVWQQNIPVKHLQTYSFKFWLSSMSYSKDLAVEGLFWQQALLKVSINGKGVGIILAPDSLYKWIPFQIKWQSKQEDTAEIKIIDLNTGGNYNDFGIDQFEFYAIADTGQIEQENNSNLNIADTISELEEGEKIITALFKDELKYRGADIHFVLEMRPTQILEKIPYSTSHNSIADFKNNEYRTDYYSVNNNIIRAYISNYSFYLFSKIGYQLGLLLISIIFSVLLIVLINNYLRKQLYVSKLKYEITNNITHELKTPVATILAATDVLQKLKLIDNKEKTQQYIEIARLQAIKLNNLISKAMDIAMVESDEFKLFEQEVDLFELLKEAAHAEHLTLIDHVQIIIDATDEPLKIKGDKFHLLNVFNALIENSIKYCDKNPIINIRLRKQNAKIIISIEDNGIGIKKEYQKIIFEKYYRIPANDRHNVQGHGLGLNYVKTMMQLHRGNILVESDGQSGTKFILIFNK